MKAKKFQDLVVWQKAHTFVLAGYRFSEKFPSKEMFALTSQFRRAAVSIPANIAEGFKKRGKREKMRLLNIAQGPLEECQYYLILSRDLGYGGTFTVRPSLTTYRYNSNATRLRGSSFELRDSGLLTSRF